MCRGVLGRVIFNELTQLKEDVFRFVREHARKILNELDPIGIIPDRIFMFRQREVLFGFRRFPRCDTRVSGWQIQYRCQRDVMTTKDV